MTLPIKRERIFAVVVTYNRRMLLLRCLGAIAAQAIEPIAVLVIDNASTDGTHEWLADWLPAHLPNAKVITLSTNTGGTGGFAAGLSAALKGGADWVWMMDDDAEPHPDALEELLARPLDAANIYSSCAVAGDRLAWPIVRAANNHASTPETVADLPDEFEVAHTPFLGIMVSAQVANAIGLPDEGYFLGRDDVEYCTRARCHGAKIVLVGSSHIEHPAATMYAVRLPWRTMYVYRIPPWKRYYIVRNRIFIAKRYYGWSAYYSTVPASVIRLASTLWHEPQRLLQTRAVFAGIIDGILGRAGRRHELWGLKP